MPRIRSGWTVADASRHLVLAAMVAVAATGAAGTLTVTTEFDELDLSSEPGACSLREAIISVNEAKDVGGCTAEGSYGNDVIELPPGTFEALRLGFFALLPKPDQQEVDFDVYGTLTIRGQGAGTTMISGGATGRALQVHEGAEVTLMDVTVRDGVAPDYFDGISDDFAGGGGILNQGALTLQRVHVRANTAATSGGGIYNAGGGTLSIVDSTIHGNAAEQVVGGGIFNAGTMEIERSTLSGNVASGTFDFGGGALLSDGTSRLENVTLSGNVSARHGGGVSVRDGVTILSSVTVAHNRANLGGGIFRATEGELRMENTIVAENRLRGSGAEDPDCLGAVDSFGHNLIGIADGCGGFGAGDLLGTQAEPLRPRLEVLELRGGPTTTHALLSGSPARDRGPLEGNDACLSIDQRGEPRPRDGDGDGLATRCDIGAYEAADAPTTADLAVRLESGPETVTPGSGVAFLAVVHNLGPSLARDVRVSVVLDDAVAPPELPSGDCTTLGQSFNCPLGDLPAGDTTGFAFDLVTPDAPGTLDTAAAVSHAGDDPSPDNDRREVTTEVRAVAADLTLTQNLDDAAVEPFGTAFVEVQVANGGPDTANGTEMRVEVLPDEATGASASFIHFGGCTPGATATEAVCPTGNLTAGSVQSATLTLQAHAAEGALAIRSTATADEEDPDGADPEVTSTLTVGAPAEPIEGADMRLVMSGPAGVTSDDAVAELPPGAPFRLRFDITNGGPQTLSNASFTHTIADGVSVEAVPGNCVLTTDPGGNDVVNCAIIELAPGDGHSFSIDAYAPSELGAFTNTASIFNGTPADPETGNNFAFLVMRVRAETADLALGVTAPESAVPGTHVNARLEVQNSGPDAARGVVVTGSAGGGAAFLAGSNGCTVSAGEARCELGALAAGAEAAVRLEFLASETPGEHELSFAVNAATADPTPDDDAVVATLNVEPVAVGSDLSLRMEAPPSVASDEAVPYTITVTNAGPESALGVSVRNPLPDGATIDVPPTACALADAVLTCDLGNLDAEGSQTLELVVRSAAATGTLVNVASVSTAGFDPNPDNDHDSVLTELIHPGAAPNLSVTAGPSAPADTNVAPGATAVPALQARLQSNQDLELTAVGIRTTGSGDDVSDLDVVRVYVDADEDGRVGDADVLLAEGAFVEDDGQLSLTFDTPRALAASASAVLLIAVDTSPSRAPTGALGLLLAVALLPLARAERRRVRSLAATMMLTLLLLACGTGDSGIDLEATTHRLTLQAVSGTAEFGPVVPEGLPLDGAVIGVD